jgi:AbrB family looped-hinge helix DNA binding protein
MSGVMIFKTRLRAKGQLTLPGQVRELLGVSEGDDLTFYVTEGGQVVIEPARTIPPDQAWFWTERWQKMEREAQAEINAGRVHHNENVDEAIKALNKIADAEY